MERLGIIGGHAIAGSENELLEGERRSVSTEGGDVRVLEGEHAVVVQRHGADRYVPAHAIDHAANVQALLKLGCERVLSVCSVGSLRADIGVGAFVCPDDFIALHVGDTSLSGGGGERVPGFDATLRSLLVGSWRGSGALQAAGELLDGGVYWQAIGPRFETPAEIRLIARHADVIGMTLGSECVIAGEHGVACAAICVVDNLANGVGAEPLSRAEFEAGKRASRERVVGAVRALARSLAMDDGG